MHHIVQSQSQFALFVKYFIGKAIRCLQIGIHIIHVWSDANRRRGLYINVTVHRNKFLFNNQPVRMELQFHPDSAW